MELLRIVEMTRNNCAIGNINWDEFFSIKRFVNFVRFNGNSTKFPGQMERPRIKVAIISLKYQEARRFD